MKTLRFIHIGDMHLDLKYMDKINLSLEQIIPYCRGANAVIIPGDLLHCKQSYGNNSAVPALHSFLRKLALLVDFIFIVKGNNQHDEPGSIALLHQLEQNIYAYEYPVVLAVKTDPTFLSAPSVRDVLRDTNYTREPEYIVSLVPYPQKSGFITNTSIDNNNNDFLEKFEQIFELIGDVTQDYTCPKILGFHGNVVGSRLSSGQSLVSQDIMVAPSTLLKANADYYALNHIHIRQEIQPFMVYAGGIANFNWGETEQKSFEEILISENGGLEYRPILLNSAKPMITVNLHFTNGKFEFDAGEDEENTGIQFAEFRVRVDVKENERSLITDESIGYLKSVYGNDAKIEITTLPATRESRSEIIMSCRTLADEVTEYGTVIDADVFSTCTEVNFLKPSILEKIALVEEAEVCL